MINDLTPNYLTSLIPATVSNTSAYQLRDSENVRPLLTRTQLYYKSFLPSSIRNWNKLPLNIRNSSSLASFKRNKDNNKVPIYYSSGNRQLQIYHTRLRTNCSSLNQHIYSKNIIADPSCACGSVESTKHCLLQCPQFNQARTEMLNTLSTVCIPSLNVLLYGDNNLDTHYNKLIFETVQNILPIVNVLRQNKETLSPSLCLSLCLSLSVSLCLSLYLSLSL